MKTRILHAGFHSQSAALAARQHLLDAGFLADQISVFAYDASLVSNTTHEITHDISNSTEDLAQVDHPAEAAEAGNGAVSGAVGGTAAGIAVGLVTSPFVGPLGVVTGGAVGAYVGSLLGALNQLEDTPEAVEPNLQSWPWRVAVATPSPVQQCAAIDLLTAHDGHDLHDANGQLVAGTWIDFNPIDHFRVMDAEAIARLREQSAASV